MTSQAAALATGTSGREPAPASPSARGRRRRWEWSALGFVGPSVLLALAFLIVPMGAAFVYGFAKINSLSGKTEFIGGRNYAAMFSDPTFFRALVNTAIFTALTVPLSMAIGLALAVLMNSVLPARKVFRTVVYLPLVISGVSVGLIGTFLYNEIIGVVNKMLGTLSLPGVPWQSDGFWAFTSVVLVTLWIRIGFNMIIYLAGLQGVPVELHESAQVEGAGRWQRFRFITFPLLGTRHLFFDHHERDLHLPGFRHHLRPHQRWARLGDRGAGHLRLQDRLRPGP